MNRREFLAIASVPLAQALDGAGIRGSRGAVIGEDGARLDAVELIREWSGSFCRSRLVNRGRVAVRVKEVVLFDTDLKLPPATVLYGEGFQMLTQTGGTVAEPVDLSQYTDAKHYRIPASDGARAYYGLLTLTPPGARTQLFAFTSCARFSGRFEVRLAPAAQFAGHADGDSRAKISAMVDTEALTLGPGEAWPLEELMVASGADRSHLLTQVADRLATHHAPLRVRSAPTGWCSWYCFGPDVTAQQVLDNLDAIARSLPR
jgi:alpha-galactosidase